MPEVLMIRNTGVNNHRSGDENTGLFATLAIATIGGMARKRISDEDAAAAKAIGKRVGYAAGERGIGSNELDRATGHAQGQTSRLMRGLRKSVTTAVLEKYAKALRVRIEWLRTGEEPMNPSSHMVQSTLEEQLRGSHAELGNVEVSRANAEVGLDNLAWAVSTALKNGVPYPLEVVERVRSAAERAGEPIERVRPRQWELRLDAEHRAFIREQAAIIEAKDEQERETKAAV